MKFLAILKDSFREALDSKVFYATVGLSLLLILLVGSISFQPVSAEEAFKTIVGQNFRRSYRDHGRSIMPVFVRAQFEVQELQRTTEASEPQACDYRFRLLAHDIGANALGQSALEWDRPADTPVSTEDAAKVPDTLLIEFVKDLFATAGNIDVARVELKRNPTVDEKNANNDKQSLVFEVETRGSRAVRAWLHDPCLFFGALPLRFMRTSLGSCVYVIEDGLVNGLGGWVGILTGVVITAFFIPNMLRKGTVDLLLVKPIHRWALLVSKYVGGLTFVFLNSVLAIGGIWLVLGLRSGIWANGFLLSIFVLTFFFAILYSVSTLMGVLTRSVIVAILLTCVAWFGLWIVGKVHTVLDGFRSEAAIKDNLPNWAYVTADAFHFVLPRTSDLNELNTHLLSRQVLTDNELRMSKLDRAPSVSWAESLTVSGAFIAVMLGLSCLWFAYKDY